MKTLTRDQLSQLRPNIVGPSRAMYYDGRGKVGPPGTHYDAQGRVVDWESASMPPPERTDASLKDAANKAQAQSAAAMLRVAERKGGRPSPVQTGNVETTGNVTVGTPKGDPDGSDAVKAAQEALERGEAVKADQETVAAIQEEERKKEEEARAAAAAAKKNAGNVDSILEQFKSPAAMTKAVNRLKGMLDDNGVDYEDGYPATGAGAMRKNAEFLSKYAE